MLGTFSILIYHIVQDIESTRSLGRDFEHNHSHDRKVSVKTVSRILGMFFQKRPRESA